MRMFFMGVLGWVPDVVMRQADVSDLRDAFLGYKALRIAQDISLPSKDFMREMAEKFPDNI